MDRDSYAFGAKRTVAKDTTLDMGVGGKMRSNPDYSLSNSYRGVDSQTNMLEESLDPLSASPMLGMRFNHKF